VLFDTEIIEIGSVSVIVNCFSFFQRAFLLRKNWNFNLNTFASQKSLNSAGKFYFSFLTKQKI